MVNLLHNKCTQREMLQNTTQKGGADPFLFLSLFAFESRSGKNKGHMDVGQTLDMDRDKEEEGEKKSGKIDIPHTYIA